MSRNIFAEEGRTRYRIFGVKARNYLLLCALVSVLAGWVYWRYWLWPGYRPLQQIYFRSFLAASFKSWVWPASSKGGYQILAGKVKGRDISIANDDTAYPARNAEGDIIEDQYGYVFRADQDTKITALDWRRVNLRHGQAAELFRGLIYRKSLLDLLTPAGIV